MKACRDLQPVLSRLAEAEASPDEALLAARHLEDCTACRIVLAKERRLAEMLEHDLGDHVAVGEEFLERVMDRLPDGPPPRPRRRRNRRGLTVAALGGLSLLAAGASATWPQSVTSGVGRSLLGGSTMPSAEGVSAQLERGAGVVIGLLDLVGSGLGGGFPAVLGGAAITLIVPLAITALGLSGLLVVAAARLLRAQDRP